MLRAMTRWCLAALVGCAAPAPLPTAREVAPIFPAGTWRRTTPAPFDAAGMLLATDGRVMVQELSTEAWWMLAPDAMGDYARGTWSRLAGMAPGYSPLYYASGVLRDGSVIVMGGEYIAGNPVFSNRGAIYDPIADRWQSLPGPPGWTTIGDASGVVLASGQFLLSDCCTDHIALFDERTQTFQQIGTGKRDINDEESWVQLPDDTILTVDANNTQELRQTEIFDPDSKMWLEGGLTPVQISDLNPDNSGSHEVGPHVLDYDGNVLAIGGNGHNAIYDTTFRTWRIAPDLPRISAGQLDVADGPAAVEPNGTVLIAASPGVFEPPTVMLEWNGSSFTTVTAPPDAANQTSYQHTMLVLPSGEILMTSFTPDVEVYTPAPGNPDSAVPVITDIALADGTAPQGGAGAVATLYAGRTYAIAGERLNGTSQGAYYGDDVQSYTNYPVARLTNIETRHVRYCRTFDFSSRSIAPDARSTAKLAVPLDVEGGLAKLEVVANGIASPAITVNVK